MLSIAPKERDDAMPSLKIVIRCFGRATYKDVKDSWRENEQTQLRRNDLVTMRFGTFFSATVLAVTTLATSIYDTNGTNTTYIGPENGHLVIVGGNLQSESIYQRIISLAGGPNASIVVVPTAGGDPTYDQNFTTAVAFRKYGATNVTVLHTYDSAVADTDEFIAPLLGAKGIFFGGGRQWRLVDAYAGTKTEAAFQKVLDAGGVISGSSAGASIIGSFLARGDTANNTILIGE